MTHNQKVYAISVMEVEYADYEQTVGIFTSLEEAIKNCKDFRVENLISIEEYELNTKGGHKDVFVYPSMTKYAGFEQLVDELDQRRIDSIVSKFTASGFDADETLKLVALAYKSSGDPKGIFRELNDLADEVKTNKQRMNKYIKKLAGLSE